MSAFEYPAWARWKPSPDGAEYTLGVEEELMMVHPEDWSLAHRIEWVLPKLSAEVAEHVSPETHGSVLELATGVHTDVGGAVRELGGLRANLEVELEAMGLRAASAGTHPFAVWQDVVISRGERQEAVYGSMRELARREPTFALHVHVGVRDPETAIALTNRLRGHLPLLLALSVNSPFWQGRDTGLASARTPLFQAFPRVGIPRSFDDYRAYVEAVDLVIRCEAFPEPSFLWWDVRPQARFGTVEVRIMDAQTTVDETAAIVALVQSVARLEAEEGFHHPALLESPEILVENRFFAARDGMDGALIDAVRETRVPARQLLSELLKACAPHAEDLGCASELEGARELAAVTGSARQLALAKNRGSLKGLLGELAGAYSGSEAGALTRLDTT
ncbi:MAG: carboxylate-amine ligase [Thermoleophilaceae bacterium]